MFCDVLGVKCWIRQDPSRRDIRTLEAVSKLKKAQEELKLPGEQVEWYTNEISIVNHKYIELKRAYDALDIEYAQLYEKQNALMVNQPS